MARNWEAGHVIMNRYRLVSLLGQGGMGSVWRAEHIELKNQVAIKLLDPAIAQNEEMIARFLREARAAASLQNRHVIQIFDHGVADGEAFMVMELLHGETLGERIQRKGKLEPEEMITFMVQVMRAMAKAHERGIIHRDLKPDNIFITSDDDGEYAKILDFGVAKVGGDLGATNGVKTQTGMMLGTPFYMSPEQAKAKKVDARTDVWALAVISYECLTGKRPFTGDSFADLVLTLCNAPIPLPSRIAQVPVGFDEWFVHGTQRDVERRFRDARAMASELIHLAHAPLTHLGPAGSSLNSESSGMVRTPTPMGGGPQRKMNLTTGQSAAVGVDRRRPLPQQSRSGIGWLIAAAMLLSTLGGGFLAWRNSQADEVSTAQPAVEPELDSVAEIERADKTPDTEIAPADPKPTAEKLPTGNEQAPVEAEAPAPEPVAQPAPRAPSRTTSAQPSTRNVAPKDSQPAEAQPAPEPKNTVPVVDSNALPPTEWEF